MSKPFPGMNPYLEHSWGDIHTRLTTYSCDALQTQLPKGLKARVEEQVRVDMEGATTVRLVPDVRVVEPSHSEGGVAVAEEVQVAAPLVVEFLDQPVTERRIVIVDQSSGGRVVTAIEFVSPSNKTSQKERERFRRKQADMVDGGVNVVEIDLVRQGRWVLSVPERLLPDEYAYPYAICLIRATAPHRGECFAVSLREPLPVIPIPLRESDPDVALRLQTILDLAVERGAYDDVDYTGLELNGFAPEDEAWMRERLQAAGLLEPRK